MTRYLVRVDDRSLPPVVHVNAALEIVDSTELPIPVLAEHAVVFENWEGEHWYLGLDSTILELVDDLDEVRPAAIRLLLDRLAVRLGRCNTAEREALEAWPRDEDKREQAVAEIAEIEIVAGYVFDDGARFILADHSVRLFHAAGIDPVVWGWRLTADPGEATALG